MSRRLRTLLTCLLLVFTFMQLSFASSPSEWLDDDWIKFIDAAVSTVAGEMQGAAAQAIGSSAAAPLTETYAALSAVGSAVKPGLRWYLHRRMDEAVFAEDWVAYKRYNAFWTCMEFAECEDLSVVQAEHQSIINSQAGAVVNITSGYAGTVIDIISVPNDRPERVTTLPLVNGARYLLIASGVISDWSDQTEGVDAVWCYAEWICGAGEVWHQLRINNQGLVALAGRDIPYNPGHVYAIEIYGTGEPLELHTYDAVDLGSYGDNSGEFLVEIRRLD